MDDLGIVDLSVFEFPETTEEISLFNNEIENPKYIINCLVPLPRLKALWLNENPVVSACSNFHSISELMPNLEIINSVLTSKAGAWAMLYYARDQGAKTLDQIESLSLAGKGLHYLESVDFFKEMTNLKRLDISDHPEFFMTEEAKEANEFKELMGISKEEKDKVKFSEHKTTVQEILAVLNSVEDLTCDEDLEGYILGNRADLGFLPNLRLLNDISIENKDMGDRKRIHAAAELFNSLQRVVGHYLYVENGQ